MCFMYGFKTGFFYLQGTMLCSYCIAKQQCVFKPDCTDTDPDPVIKTYTRDQRTNGLCTECRLPAV
jgi:hypothetical protein